MYVFPVTCRHSRQNKKFPSQINRSGMLTLKQGWILLFVKNGLILVARYSPYEITYSICCVSTIHTYARAANLLLTQYYLLSTIACHHFWWTDNYIACFMYPLQHSLLIEWGQSINDTRWRNTTAFDVVHSGQLNDVMGWRLAINTTCECTV